MKLRQLSYIREVARRDLNITAAAEALHTSQPGISKQIKLLEEELGVTIFARSGKHLTEITPAGEEILQLAERILSDVSSVRTVADEFRHANRGTLRLATTHTQARYALPSTISAFRQRYANVSLQINQGSPPQIAQWAASGESDFAIATEAMEHFEELVMLPCYHWNRCILVPPGHALTQPDKVSLEDISRHPIITYTFGFTGRSMLDKAFVSRGLKPDVVLTAVDADVIKTYVRLGLGIGIIANMAYDPQLDGDLVALDVRHLFDDSTTHIGFRRSAFLRGFMYEFIHMFAPHLDHDVVKQAASTTSREDREPLIQSLWDNLPRY